jgi:RNA polymerase sigma-70 factor (ECF subfamily)
MHPENERGFLPIQNPKIYPDFKNRPFEELSEILETSVGALKASYHFAVKKIEAYLEKN